MRVRYQAAPHPEIWWVKLVGVAGFEPATSCSQSRRDDRATLHPEKVVKDSANYKVCKSKGSFYIEVLPLVFFGAV